MTVSHEDTVRSYLGDLIAVVEHVSQAVAKQVGDDDLRRVAYAGDLIQNLNSVLMRQHTDLQDRVKAMGGATAGGVLKDVLTTVTGTLAGLYGKSRGETASRMLRDDYTALNFVMTCTAMLHTTALAFGDSATAEITRHHLHEYPRLIMALSDMVPRAVLADFEADKVPLANAAAGEEAVRHLREAWQSASSTSPTTHPASGTPNGSSTSSTLG